ncbi:MAG: insulinase family protein [Bacteroidetes bacterium]|nr:insulinase family protein [Bacteroidota bacterium]
MKFTKLYITYFISIILLVACTAIAETKSNSSYNYESIPNDILGTRIYTLENGFKVYMTVYKDAPRIQTYVAVKTGSKNDPADATGLAHYLEHLLLKAPINLVRLILKKKKKNSTK